MPQGRKREAKALRDEYTHTIEPARALAAETLAPGRTLSESTMQVSVLTIDTIPPLAFTPCAAKTPPPLRGNADGRMKIAESGGRSPLMR